MNPERHEKYFALIPAYLSDQLSALEATAAALHFEQCDECSAELRYARQLHAHFRQQHETASVWDGVDAAPHSDASWLSPAHAQQNLSCGRVSKKTLQQRQQLRQPRRYLGDSGCRLPSRRGCFAWVCCRFIKAHSSNKRLCRNIERWPIALRVLTAANCASALSIISQRWICKICCNRSMRKLLMAQRRMVCIPCAVLCRRMPHCKNCICIRPWRWWSPPIAE